MEMESYDTRELHHLDQAIRHTMEAIRNAPQFGGGMGGFTGWQQQGGGQNSERIAEMVRDRVASAVRDRVGEAVRERLRHALRERVAESIREHLGEALREQLRMFAMQPGYPV